MHGSDDFDTSKYSTGALAGLLGLHIVEKGWQVGSLLGLGIVTPALALIWRKTDAGTLTKAAAYTGIGFSALAGAAGGVKIAKIDRAGFEDRVYRLAYNEGQNRADTFSAAGMTLGAAMSWYFLKHPQVLNIIGGASYGAAVGVLAHLATRPEAQKSPNQLANVLKE